jgi:hypothetical protein
MRNHFTTKDEILDAVADALITEVDISMLGREHRLRGQRELVDLGAFELGLETLVSGLERTYGELGRSHSLAS